jgi:molybdenum cofactor cytidylyltransferase
VVLAAAGGTGLKDPIQLLPVDGETLLQRALRLSKASCVAQPCLAMDHLQKLFAAYEGSCDVVAAYGDALGPPALLHPATFPLASTLQGDATFQPLWAEGHPAAVRRDALGRKIETPGDVTDAVRAGLLGG